MISEIIETIETLEKSGYDTKEYIGILIIQELRELNLK